MSVHFDGNVGQFGAQEAEPCSIATLPAASPSRTIAKMNKRQAVRLYSRMAVSSGIVGVLGGACRHGHEQVHSRSVSLS